MPEDRYDETNANKKAEQSAMQTDGCYQKGDRREEPQDWVARYRWDSQRSLAEMPEWKTKQTSLQWNDGR